MTLRITMLCYYAGVVMLPGVFYLHYAECQYAECQYDESRYAECRSA